MTREADRVPSAERSGEGALRRAVTEAEETIAAIRAGEVDAVVVDGPAGQQIYTLESPDEPFRLFVERMQEGALTLSADETILYCNPFFANLVKQPIERVRGRPLAEFLAGGQEGALHEMLCAVTSGSMLPKSFSLRRGAETVPVQLAVSPLPAEDARMFCVVVTDMRERERAEKLEIERRAAEEAKLARDHFLAVVSHELRTPLNAVIGWAQMLRRRDDLPSAGQHGLDVILRNAWAQAQLIEDLLDVSRILAGRLRLDLKPIDLGAVVRAACASVQPAAEERRVALLVHVPPDSVTVRGDIDRLQQVVCNLVSNAVKFSPEEGEVSVTLHEDDGHAEIRVRDAGAGIPAAFLPRLFHAYQQREGATTRRSGGLGLGLAIVKQLTELHDGEVHAESPGEGRGATFIVRLPLVSDACVSGSDLASDRPREAVRGLRLLVVEDDRDARELLLHLLVNAGAHVSAAASAPEALELLKGERFDLLLCDIGLPGMDGYELIRRVRAGGCTGRDLPAIAITAFAGRQDRREALVAGYQVHLAKPLDTGELFAVVQSLAGRGSV
jgi:PAS domain S-box-containing protein